MVPWPKPSLARISSPAAPGPVPRGPGIARLSSSESPLGISPAAAAAAAEAARRGHQYPDDEGDDLIDAIASAYAIPPGHIRLGPGSEALVMQAVMAFAGPGDEVVFSARGHAQFARSALVAGATPVAAEDHDFRADPQCMLDAMSSRTRLVMLANPDNPSGAMLPMEEIEALHACLPGNVVLLLDGAYADYVRAPEYEDGGLALATSARNVLVSRTFSKLYGLAGIRLGWLAGHPHMLEAIDKAGPAFPVSLPALAAGRAALADTGHQQAARAHNDEWLPWLCAALPPDRFRVLPSQACFILLELPSPAAAAGLVSHLAAQGIFVRGFGPGPHAAQVRISIGEADALRRAAAAIATYVAAVPG